MQLNTLESTPGP